MKKKIIYLNKYSINGGSSRVRCFQYEKYMSGEFQVEYYSLFSERYLKNKYTHKSVWGEAILGYLRRFTHLLKLPFADLVWMEKEAFPYLPFFFERLVFLLSKKVIVEYDDAIFHNYDAHRLSFVRTILGKKIDKVMAKANLVVAGNEYLKQRAVSAGAKNIKVVPSVVPAARYPEIVNPPQNEVPVIGWIGTPMTQKFLLEIEDVLEDLQKINPFKLHLIGVEEDFWRDKKYRVRIAWSEPTEVPELAKIDIGIMPLVDSKFERGKCGFKLIQYMGCSKAVVASPVGVNTTIVAEGVNGFLCKNKNEWKEALLKLLQNKELRDHLGNNGRKAFVENFSVEGWAPKLIEFAHEVIGDPK